MFQKMLTCVRAGHPGAFGHRRLVRAVGGFAVVATVSGFGATFAVHDRTSVTAMPVPPLCLQIHTCGVGDPEYDTYVEQVQTECNDLREQGLSSSDCDILDP